MELENSRVEIAALAERIRQMSERRQAAQSEPTKNLFRLCISCSAKHTNAVLRKAKGLPPGTKCDECEGQAVMSIEIWTGV